MKYSEAVGASVPVARPALESRPYEELVAEHPALRTEPGGSVAKAPIAGRRPAVRS